MHASLFFSFSLFIPMLLVMDSLYKELQRYLACKGTCLLYLLSMLSLFLYNFIIYIVHSLLYTWNRLNFLQNPFCSNMDLAFSTLTNVSLPQFSYPLTTRSTISPLNLVPTTKQIRPKIAHASFDSPSRLLNQSLTQGGWSSRHKSFSLIARSTRRSGGSGDEDNKALEVVLKLYGAMKSRNHQELSDIIADECRCFCNFFSTFHPFEGKKQVLEFFSVFMGHMGKSIDFIIEPTFSHGLIVGVKWTLVWEHSNIRLPFGRGITFYTVQKYEGKLCIRHVDMYMEPFFNFAPLRLRLMEYMMPILDKIPSQDINLAGKKPFMYGLLTLLFIPILLKKNFF